MRRTIGAAKNYCGHLMNVIYREIRANDMRETINSIESTRMNDIIQMSHRKRNTIMRLWLQKMHDTRDRSNGPEKE